MFCPKCSQQQSSEEMRFCSRCGFPLAAVAIVLDNQGNLPQLESQPVPKLQRSRMLRESTYLTLVAWAVALVTTLFWDFGVPLETVAKISSLIFFLLGLVGLLRFVYAFLSVRDLPGPSPEARVLRETNQAALPPQQSMPLTDFPRRTNTREISPRPSVTENTTRLLDDQPRNAED